MSQVAAMARRAELVARWDERDERYRTGVRMTAAMAAEVRAVRTAEALDLPDSVYEGAYRIAIKWTPPR